MTLADKMQPELLSHALLRAAAWPIETAEIFAAPNLAMAAKSLLAAERAVLERRASTIAALYAAVPGISCRATRAYLIELKRHIYHCAAPLPVPPSIVRMHLAEYPQIVALLDEEGAARRKLAEHQVAFERIYAAEIERQRHALWVAATTQRFRKALMIANPQVAAHLDTEVGLTKGTPTRGRRRLETTIFHYLMRACGRTTPHGAWAGVALVSPQQADKDKDVWISVTPSSRQYNVTVNLQPFSLMLRSLARTSRYRRGYPLHLNPTLQPQENGWRYEAEANGGTVWLTLSWHPLYATIIGFYEDYHARPYTELLEGMCKMSGGSVELQEVLERLINSLVDRDVLRSNLSFPSTMPTVWDALHKITQQLVEPDRTCWAKSIMTIRILCEQLGVEFDKIEAEDVDRMRRAIEAEVQSLWKDSELPGTFTGSVVMIDMRLPFAVSWSDKFITTATETLDALLTFHAADGGAELYRRQSLQDIVNAYSIAKERPLLQLLANGAFGWIATSGPQINIEEADPVDMPDTRETVLSRLCKNNVLSSEAIEHCQMWESLLEPIHLHHTYTLHHRPVSSMASPGPGGSLLLRLASNKQCWLGPGRPEPALFVARFAELLKDEGDNEALLIEALRSHAIAAKRVGITPVEISSNDLLNYNAAIHPTLNTETLNPHGPPEIGLQEVKLLVDSDSRPWLYKSNTHCLLVPVYHASATIGLGDQCSRLLMTIARGHGWEFLAFGFPPLRAERMQWGHLPRLILPSGDVLTPERWTIDRETLTRLIGCSGASRYLAWRAEVERLGLPTLVHVRCGPSSSELLLRTDSPLAVRCLFDSIAVGAPWIAITELPGFPDNWPIKDATGQHYIAELAVTWYKDSYWDEVVSTSQRNQK